MDVQNYIDVNHKLKDCDPEKVFQNIKKHVKSLLLDFTAGMDQELYTHTCKAVAYTLCSRYKGFFWGDVVKCFDNMRTGIYEIDKITVININKVFARHNALNTDKRRTDADKYQGKEEKEIDQLLNTSYGAALAWKLENCVETKNGKPITKDWEKYPLNKIVDIRTKTGKMPVITD